MIQNTQLSTQLITIAGVDRFQLTATDEAFDRRDQIALVAGTVQTVINADQATHAAAVLRDAKAFTNIIEETRKVVKAPVLEVGGKIDQLAKDLTLHLGAECARISSLLGSYNKAEADKAQEARQRAWAEEQRILREAEAKRQADEAAARKRADELAQKEAKARSAGKAALYAEQARLEREQAEAAAQAHDEATANQIVQTRTAAVLAPVKQKGIGTRSVVKFEVTDIHALYAVRPELVKLEPNTLVINACIRGNPLASIPGLRVWEEFASVVR